MPILFFTLAECGGMGNFVRGFLWLTLGVGSLLGGISKVPACGGGTLPHLLNRVTPGYRYIEAWEINCLSFFSGRLVS